MSTRGTGTRDAVVELGGQGPLASLPRCVSTPIPSCPYLLWPQHLTVASSCAETRTTSLTGVTKTNATSVSPKGFACADPQCGAQLDSCFTRWSLPP